jgi:uncharacterized protein (DUF58 family)
VDPRLPRPAPLRRTRAGPSPASAARAARLLWVRSRRAATGWLVGGQTSPFRGGGVEFEELRPYAPGDDVRWIDWNATARSGAPWVKRFREERAHTVLVALDVSASMAFGSVGHRKLDAAAEAAAAVLAAAGQAGDRVGFLAFADRVRIDLPPARGDTHRWRMMRAVAEAAVRPDGATDLGLAVDWALRRARRRAIVVLVSDFRDPRLDGGLLGRLGVRHDLVSVVVDDPRERALVAAGTVRLTDPEGGGGGVMGTGARGRARYAAAVEAHRRALRRRLRADGSDLLWLPSEGDPLRALVGFFRTRSAPRRGIP